MVDRLNAKLTDETCKLLKIDLYRGLPQRKLADHYGISQPQVSRILYGMSWRHIPWPDGKTGSADMQYIKQKQRINISEGKLHGEAGKGTDVMGGSRDDNRPAAVPVEHPIKEGVSPHTIVIDEVAPEPQPIPKMDYEAIGKVVEKSIEGIKDVVDDRLHNAMFDVGKSPKGKKKTVKKTIQEQDQVPWDVIIAHFPNNAIVQIAVDNERYRLPLQVALASLNQDIWDDTDLQRVTEQIAQLFEYDMTVLEDKDD